MKRSSIYGIALIVGALGGVLTMMFHPTSRDLIGPDEMVARRNEIIAVATHALALTSIPISIFGFWGLSRLLGLERPLVSAALVAYAFAGAAAMCATVLSGLVAPVITREIIMADQSTQKSLSQLLWYGSLLTQGFSKVFFVASSFAVVFWSVSILRINKFSRVVGIVGCAVAFIGLVAFLSGYVRMNVHGFGLLIFAQSLWTSLLGVFLCQWKESPTQGVSTS